MAQGIFGRSKKGRYCAARHTALGRAQPAREDRTLWTGSTRPTEAQGARGEALRGRSVTLLGVTNPGRTEPATKKAHSAPQRRRILQAVSVAGARVRAEGVFPESETGGNVPQKHSSFSEFLASLKGGDEKPWVNRFGDRRRGSVRTNFPHRHKGGIPPMLKGERLRRTPERQSQAPATVLHVRGYARSSIRGGGRSGGCA
jgi:hypothetical protein